MEGATYKITALKVKEYNSKKSLSARSDSTFTQIDDIGAVESTTSDDKDETGTNTLDVVTGEIDVVVSADEYHTCTRCREPKLLK